MQTGYRRGSEPEVSLEDFGAKLIYNTTYGGKMSFDLNRSETTIGRKDDNNINLSCAKISKYHATILKNENR
jgi:adenylate cyclase